MSGSSTIQLILQLIRSGIITPGVGGGETDSKKLRKLPQVTQLVGNRAEARTHNKKLMEGKKGFLFHNTSEKYKISNQIEY